MAHKGKGKSQGSVPTQSTLFDVPTVKRVVDEKLKKPQEKLIVEVETIVFVTEAKGLNGLFENCSKDDGLRKFGEYIKETKYKI